MQNKTIGVDKNFNLNFVSMFKVKCGHDMKKPQQTKTPNFSAGRHSIGKPWPRCHEDGDSSGDSQIYCLQSNLSNRFPL